MKAIVVIAAVVALAVLVSAEETRLYRVPGEATSLEFFESGFSSPRFQLRFDEVCTLHRRAQYVYMFDLVLQYSRTIAFVHDLCVFTQIPSLPSRVVPFPAFTSVLNPHLTLTSLLSPLPISAPFFSLFYQFTYRRSAKSVLATAASG